MTSLGLFTLYIAPERHLEKTKEALNILRLLKEVLKASLLMLKNLKIWETIVCSFPPRWSDYFSNSVQLQSLENSTRVAELAFPPGSIDETSELLDLLLIFR